MQHNIQKIDAAEARRKGLSLPDGKGAKRLNEPEINAIDDDEELPDAGDVVDDSWIEPDNVENFTWPYDTPATNNSRASSRTLSPSPTPNLISAARLQAFEHAFNAIVFGLGYEDISQVVKVVNPWLKRQTPFRNGEALVALRAMEEKGLVRLKGGKVYLPEAWEMVEGSEI